MATLVNGTWKGGMGIAGTTDTVFAATTIKGKLYIAGDFRIAGATLCNRVAQWDGTEWSPLGDGFDKIVFALASDAGGNLYAAGAFTLSGQLPIVGIAKWDGTAWSALGTGINAGTVWALAFDNQGTLYAGGEFQKMDGVLVKNVARWDGKVWSPLLDVNGPDRGCNGAVMTLAYDPQSGGMYAGGAFTAAGSMPAARIALWAGGHWQPLDVGIMANAPLDSGLFVSALALSGSGTLYVGGRFWEAGGKAVTNFATWSAPNWQPMADVGGSENTVRSLTWIDGQFLCVAGEFNHVGGLSGQPAPNSIAVFDTYPHRVASHWSRLGTGVGSETGRPEVWAVVTDGSGNLYAGGDFTSAGGHHALRIAKWNGKGWSALGDGMGLDGSGLKLATDNAGHTYVAGQFEHAGTIASSNVVEWDGGSWVKKLGGDGPVAADATGKLYTSSKWFNENANGNNIGEWRCGVDGLDQQLVGRPTLDCSLTPNPDVLALVCDAKNVVYVAGSFADADLWPDGATTNVNYIAMWNGAAYVSVGGGVSMGPLVFVPVPPRYNPNGPRQHPEPPPFVRLPTTLTYVNALALDGNGNLYAGGWFKYAGGVAANNVAKWNGKTWTPLGLGTDSVVMALALDNRGTLYAGGIFQHAGGTPASFIAKWDGATWSSVGTGTDGYVFSLAADSAGTVVAGGNFKMAGGLNANHIAKWDGTAWSTLGGGLNDVVRAVTIDSNGCLAAAGDFSMADGMPSVGFAFYS